MPNITPRYPFAAGTVRSQRQSELLSGLRLQFQDLQRQLSSGKVSETYGGLGQFAVSSLSLRNQGGVNDGYTSVADLANVRLKLLIQGTNELRTTTEQARSVLLQTRGTGGFPQITSAKQQVQASFEQLITSLNSQNEGLYQFAGRNPDTRPVVDANTLLFGDGVNAGLRQVIDERRQADLGAGLGRLVTSNVGATTTLAEDAVGNPFGIKLVAGSVGGSISNVTVTGPTGAPSQIDFNFTGQPLSGERISFTVLLPDGKTRSIGFAVDSASTSEDTVFARGATPAATAANLQAAINSRFTSIGNGELRSASALVASREFFSGSNTVQPPRVAGPPFATSTTYAPVGSRPTVIWYRGDDDPTVRARDTQRAEIDSGTSVGLGARANETAFKDTLTAFGLFLAEDYPAGTPSTQDRFDAATARAIEILGSTGGPNAILEVNSEFGVASGQVARAKTRHTDTKQFLNGLLADIENVKNEEVAVQLVNLQTQLQAAYQTTTTLSRLTLANFL